MVLIDEWHLTLSASAQFPAETADAMRAVVDRALEEARRTIVNELASIDAVVVTVDQ